MNRLALQQGLLALAFYRQSRLPRSLAIGTRAASTIAETSFWKQLVPKPLRASARGSGSKKTKSTQGWNPATYFIVMFLFIGSMSIQMIALKRDFSTFMRQSDVRIGLLKEVVEKLQRGEEVDVEKALGTGDPEKELAWEDGVQTLEMVFSSTSTDGFDSVEGD